MMLKPYRGNLPKIHETVFVADGAVIVGDVEIEPGASIWFNVVMRGDREKIIIGERTSIQDGSVVHVSDGFPCVIGKGVTVGHQATLHGCEIGDFTLVGIKSTILDGVVIGEGSVVAAGALVPPGKKFPPRSFLIGIPARRERDATPAEYQRNIMAADIYCGLAEDYIKGV